MGDSTVSNRPYTIVVACGTAIATSTHVSMKIKEEMGKRGKSINIIQCRVQEIPRYMDSASIIVSTTNVPFDVKVPVFDGIPFLTGIGLEEVINKIDQALK
jgi:galactitol PTS system EIIB component